MINEIDFNDGKIISLEILGDKVEINYLNWEEIFHKLLFTDVIHMEYLNAGVDTGDFIVNDNRKKVQEKCKQLDEDEISYKSFKLMCSWGEHTLIEIIAKEVTKIT